MKFSRSIQEDIKDSVSSHEWTTDNNDVFNAVLVQREDQLILNVDVANITKPIAFDYIYRESKHGIQTTLVPFPDQYSKTIHVDPIRESWPVPIYLVHKDISNSNDMDGGVMFLFKSFVWSSLPIDNATQKVFEEMHESMSGIDTKIGKVTVALVMHEGHSTNPVAYTKSIEGLKVTIEPKNDMDYMDIVRWHSRFEQYLSFIFQEKVKTLSISKNSGSIYVPSLADSGHYEAYGWRKPISLDELAVYVSQTLKKFVNDYEDLSNITSDLHQYYIDYPHRPPDNIQLLRLFTSIEQVSSHAHKNLPVLKRKLTKEEKDREANFNNMLNELKPLKSVKNEIKKYLSSKTKKFYVSEGSLGSPKNKIHSLAEYLYREYSISNAYIDINNIEIMLAMRGLVAHGKGKEGAWENFYKARNEYGQDLEKIVRAYLLITIGAEKEVVARHVTPLKAVQFRFS